MNKKITCRDPHGNAKEVSVDELSFRPSIYGVVIEDGQVLLVPQWDGYDFPGGGIDMGEPILDALGREIKEETGFDAEPVQLLHVSDSYFLHPYTGKASHSILIYYLCKIVGGELSDEGFDDQEKEYAKKAGWFQLDQIDNLEFYNPIDSPELIREAMACNRMRKNKDFRARKNMGPGGWGN